MYSDNYPRWDSRQCASHHMPQSNATQNCKPLCFNSVGWQNITHLVRRAVRVSAYAPHITHLHQHIVMVVLAQWLCQDLEAAILCDLCSYAILHGYIVFRHHCMQWLQCTKKRQGEVSSGIMRCMSIIITTGRCGVAYIHEEEAGCRLSSFFLLCIWLLHKGGRATVTVTANPPRRLLQRKTKMAEVQTKLKCIYIPGPQKHLAVCI